MLKLPTNMRNTDSIQNMVRTHPNETNKIMPILTSNNQYGYKEGVSTIDAIIKVEQYFKQTGNKAKYH